MEQRGDLGGLRDAQLDEGEDAELRGEDVVALRDDGLAVREEGVELVHEVGIEVDEGAVEHLVELSDVVLDGRQGLDLLDQVLVVAAADVLEYVVLILPGRGNVLRQVLQVQGNVLLPDLAGLLQLAVQGLELLVHILKRLVAPVHAGLLLLQRLSRADQDALAARQVEQEGAEGEEQQAGQADEQPHLPRVPGVLGGVGLLQGREELGDLPRAELAAEEQRVGHAVVGRVFEGAVDVPLPVQPLGEGVQGGVVLVGAQHVGDGGAGQPGDFLVGILLVDGHEKSGARVLAGIGLGHFQGLSGVFQGLFLVPVGFGLDPLQVVPLIGPLLHERKHRHAVHILLLPILGVVGGIGGEFAVQVVGNLEKRVLQPRRNRFQPVSGQDVQRIGMVARQGVFPREGEIRLRLAVGVAQLPGQRPVPAQLHHGGVQAVGLEFGRELFPDLVFLLGGVLPRQHLPEHVRPLLEIAFVGGRVRQGRVQLPQELPRRFLRRKYGRQAQHQGPGH